MDVEAELREALESRSRSAPPEPPFDALLRTARSSRRRHVAARGFAGVAAVCVALAGGTAVVAALDTPRDRSLDVATPAQEGRLGWPARGERADDAELRTSAFRTWQDSSGKDLSNPRTLYAGRVGGSTVVVLEAVEADAGARVAIVVDDPVSALPSSFRVVHDRATADPHSDVFSVSVVTAGAGGGLLVVAPTGPPATLTYRVGDAAPARSTSSDNAFVVPFPGSDSDDAAPRPATITVDSGGRNLVDGPIDATVAVAATDER